MSEFIPIDDLFAIKRREARTRSMNPTDEVRSNIHTRLDRLRWGRFHWLVVGALGASWAIDGLEVTLTGAVGAVLQNPLTLGLTPGLEGKTIVFRRGFRISNRAPWPRDAHSRGSRSSAGPRLQTGKLRRQTSSPGR